MADERVGEGDDVARHRGLVPQLLFGQRERHVDPEVRAGTGLAVHADPATQQFGQGLGDGGAQARAAEAAPATGLDLFECIEDPLAVRLRDSDAGVARSEEHTSALQSLLRISYAVFCSTK